MADYYQALGVSREASSEEINRAFRRWARTNHPDMGGDAELFKEMSVGRDRLLNPQERVSYDAGLSPEEAPVEVARTQTEAKISELAGLHELLSRIETLPIPEKQDWALSIKVSQLFEQLDDKYYALRRYADNLYDRKLKAEQMASEERQYALRQQIYRAQKENPNMVQELERRLIEMISQDSKMMKGLRESIEEQLRPIQERMKEASVRLKEVRTIAKGPEPVREAQVTPEPPKEPSFWERLRGKRR